jgi:hypothetical protein
MSLQTLFISPYIGVYACAILYPINFNRLWAHYASGVPRDLIAIEFAEWISSSWRFGAFEMSKNHC